MVILLKKTVRDMLRNKRSYATCILLIAIAVLFLVAMSTAIERVKISRDIYYNDYNLADIYAKVNAIPQYAKDNLLAIDGIRDVRLRVVEEFRVNIEDSEKIVTMRLISVPDTDGGELINGVYYIGNDLSFDNDIWVDRDFMDIYGKNIGDEVSLIINGRDISFNISGSAGSPEYVFIVKNALEILPDPETFSIGFIRESALAKLLAKNTYNDICFTLENGYKYDSVKAAIEDELSKYGLREIYEKADQVSYLMLDTEIVSMESMSTSIPFVFMFMAMMILYLMLKRVIEQDRTQIGTLRAFGYSAGKVLLHYLLYGIITGLIGGALGCIGGYFAADAMGTIYATYFKMPEANVAFVMGHVVTGIAVSVITGALGAYLGARKILRLLPAEAMRPQAPKAVKSDPLAGLPFIGHILTSTGNMALRSINRNKLRSAFVVVGVMFSFGLLAFMGSYNDMIEVLMMDQYTKIQTYDMKINLVSPVPPVSAINSAYEIDGVSLAESIVELPAELNYRHKRKGVLLQGLNEGSSLYKIYDNKRRIHLPPPKDGIILSGKLADSLEIKKGNLIKVSSDYINDDIYLPVSDIISVGLGSSAFIEAESLKELFRLPDIATSVLISADDSAYLKDYLKSGKNISFIEDVKMTLNNYTTFLEPYAALIYVMEFISAFVAAAIIYNVSTISLSERQREYATLRVIGMQVGEVAEIMAFEYWLLCILGIGLGFPFTGFLKGLVAGMMDVEMFTFPTYTPLSAYVIGVAGCIAAVKLANISAKNRIKKLDMVEVLKERE